MRHTPVPQLAVLSMCLVAHAGEFEFRDEAACDGRSVMQFRPVVLTATPSRPLEAAGETPTPRAAGETPAPQPASYGLLLIGSSPESALQLVWDPTSADSSEVGIDLDRDGRLARDERFMFDTGKIDVPIELEMTGEAGAGRLLRTLVLKRSNAGDGLLHAVRGYMTGTLAIGTAEHRAVLVDGNADGRFDGPAADRLWLDLDDDGRFDALGEHFLLGTPLTLDDGLYTISVDAAGRRVQAHRRSDRKGWLNLALGLSDKPSIQKASVDLVSDLGELTSIRNADSAVRVPVANYRIAGLTLNLADADGRSWEFQFNGRGKYDHRVTEESPTTVEPLAGLEPRIDLSVRGSASDVERTIVVTPTLISRSGLYLANCSVRRPFESVATSTQAEIRLLGPGGKVVAGAVSGFA